MHPYSRIDTTAALKKLRFISSDKSGFHMIDNLSIAVHSSKYNTSKILKKKKATEIWEMKDNPRQNN